MRILEPTYEILTPIDGEKELKNIERIARVCYKSEDRITDTSAHTMIVNLIKNEHLAMLEHSQLSVKFTVDRGVSHEIVRHRLASFAQSSTRYCNYSKDKFGNEISVINLMGGIRLDTKCQALDVNRVNEIMEEWENSMRDAEKHYMKMLELGATPQIARSVLPNSVMTEIVVTANYREWRTIFKLRADKPAHPQMREVMIPLLNELKQKLPDIFGDLEFV